MLASICFYGTGAASERVSSFLPMLEVLVTSTIAQSNAEPERPQERKSNEKASALYHPYQPLRLRNFNRPRITEDEISNGFFLAESMSRKVVKVGLDTVVKYGSKVVLAEAEAMIFVRDNTTVPVPEILNAYNEDGTNYIIMEHIDGALLKDVWDRLSAEDKSTITKELQDYVGQLRRIFVPEGTLIGSVNGGPAIDRRQFSSAIGGPFRSEQEFNEWQLAQLHPEVPVSGREMYAGVHKSNHRIVFTHGDLAFHNIMVKDGHINAILDWEYSGWYPEHWDYCKSLSFLEGTDEGYLVCKTVYEKQYHTEYFMNMWFGREVLHGGF